MESIKRNKPEWSGVCLSNDSHGFPSFEFDTSNYFGVLLDSLEIKNQACESGAQVMINQSWFFFFFFGHSIFSKPLSKWLAMMKYFGLRQSSYRKVCSL